MRSLVAKPIRCCGARWDSLLVQRCYRCGGKLKKTEPFDGLDRMPFDPGEGRLLQDVPAYDLYVAWIEDGLKDEFRAGDAIGDRERLALYIEANMQELALEEPRFFDVQD